MVKVVSGINPLGEPCEFYLDENLQKNLDHVKNVVSKKDFDYVGLICGLPGQGKSTLGITCCRYCCEWFDETYIAFTAKEFIEITNRCTKYSAVLLDESFASLNSKVTMTTEFVKVVNHLQIIRQKNLYIFMCLPNFFDLSKGVAIYRASHLFVCYGEAFGDRGRFAAFGREEKKKLYILGQKFMNYQATRPNFRGKFTRQKVIDEERYKELKLEHLKQQEVDPDQGKSYRLKDIKDKLIAILYLKGMSVLELMKITNLTDTPIYNSINNGKELLKNG